MTDTSQRLIVVSNRLPIVVSEENGQWRVSPGSGGLVTALAPVLRQRGGVWIGSPGTPPEASVDSLLEEVSQREGYTLRPVALEEDLIKGYYGGFSNEILWPLFHDMLGRCNFEPGHWEPYREANRRFAQVIARETQPDDFVWVQDYHLLLVGEALHGMGVGRRCGFFLHIPFPPPDIFRRLPWRRDIIQGMLRYRLLGFHTEHDRRNFLRTVRAVIPEARVESRRRTSIVTLGDLVTRVGAFPIGIDFDQFQGTAKTHEVDESAWLFHENLPNRKIILGVDRLDYTKGIRRRLRAFMLFLEQHPEFHKHVSLVQVVVPSRVDVPEYQAIKRQLDEMVGHINGKFSYEGWVPVHYEFRSIPFVQLIGAYRASEICLVTPLRDGMNLVAKEYCASHIDNRGVLILSEFAGAAAQLKIGAIMVNPNDIVGIADAIHQALTMDEEEKVARMKRMRVEVRRNDVHRWAASFLRAADLD
ncbi:trehalose-6-phosphate synthase [Candidatus Sumerlaeota bacterium]|nr:trehalose-6-phosphate synthase [Candidatus Sumerlaeota bacterium]